MAEEIAVYQARDNTVELGLNLDGQAIDHTAITRVQLIVSGRTLDSAVSPSLFDFSLPTRLVLHLGFAGLVLGRCNAQLVVYDIAHPHGVVWGTLLLNVKF